MGGAASRALQFMGQTHSSRVKLGGERGVGGMEKRFFGAMALLLFQALPEGLPASAEPAQVGGGAKAACMFRKGLRPRGGEKQRVR